MATVDGRPNTKVLDSLRYSGYSNYEAIEDIIDNSIDAGASEINVGCWTAKKKTRFFIADNGKGMDKETLIEALRLGSETTKDKSKDLGRFGMGLVTGSISFCDRIVVYTQAEGEPLLRGVLDLDKVFKNNSFDNDISRVRKNDSVYAMIKEELSITDQGYGTIIVLEKCDPTRLTFGNTSNFHATLSKRLSKIYRCFLENGVKIFVGSPSPGSKRKEVKAVDPLELGTPGTKLFFDGTVELPGNQGVIKVRLSILPKTLASEAEVDINMMNQGFSVLRNGREIIGSTWFGRFARHNQYNRVRGEIHMSAEQDEVIGTQFNKKNIAYTGKASPLVKALEEPVLSLIHRWKKHQAAQENVELLKSGLTTDADNMAIKKAKDKSTYMIGPKVKKEVRTRTGASPTRKSNSVTSAKIRKPKKAFSISNTPIPRYVYLNMGASAAPWDSYREKPLDREITLRYNTDHKFFKNFFRHLNTEHMASIHMMVYADELASEKVIEEHENLCDTLNLIRAYRAQNLTALFD